MNFKEFLQDYEESEHEKIRKFVRQFDDGTFSHDDQYPPKERFVKLGDTISTPATGDMNIWGLIPFNGSTIISLLPMDDEKTFNEAVKDSGFSSRKIDEMIDFVKDTGRLQFGLMSDPTDYMNLKFLEPLFSELKPPLLIHKTDLFAQSEMSTNYLDEFNTLSQHGFSKDINAQASNVKIHLKSTSLHKYTRDYVILKILGYDELVDEIGTLMILDTEKAKQYFQVFGNLIVDPVINPLRPIYNFDRNQLTNVYNAESDPVSRVDEHIPYEVGGSLLNKMIHYPETLDGCIKVLQKYDDYELSKVRSALNEGIKKENADAIADNRTNISEIFDNVWADSAEVNTNSSLVNCGVTLNLALIGTLATGLPGILAGLGFQIVDKLWGCTGDHLSENIAKRVSPNHLVAIYEFKKKHGLKD